jgi:hypothetical protein
LGSRELAIAEANYAAVLNPKAVPYFLFLFILKYLIAEGER